MHVMALQGSQDLCHPISISRKMHKAVTILPLELLLLLYIPTITGLPVMPPPSSPSSTSQSSSLSSSPPLTSRTPHPTQKYQAQQKEKGIPYNEAVENLDLRFLDYHISEDNLGDDLLLEFKSNNLSGIVRLNRVDDNHLPGSETSQQGRKKKEESEEPYDQKGAMYFAVSVVSMYGLSIGVLVAFSLRRDWDEDEVKHFQRSWVKMDHMMEKQEKQRAKKMMTNAIIAIHSPNKNSTVATMTSQAVYMALAPAIPLNDAFHHHGGDHGGGRLWSNLPSIAEAPGGGSTGGGASSGVPTESSSLAVSAMTLDEGPVRSPPSSRSDLEASDLDTADGGLNRQHGGEEEESDSLDDVVQDPDDDSASLDEIERMLEEGQLEAQLSVDMPDGDFDIQVPGVDRGGAGGVVPQSDTIPLVPKERPSLQRNTSYDDSDEVFLRPEKKANEKAPLRTLLGLLSPSLPFMDDEVANGAGGNRSDEQQQQPQQKQQQQGVWSSLTGQRSTQV